MVEGVAKLYRQSDLSNDVITLSVSSLSLKLPVLKKYHKMCPEWEPQGICLQIIQCNDCNKVTLQQRDLLILYETHCGLTS